MTIAGGAESLVLCRAKGEIKTVTEHNLKGVVLSEGEGVVIGHMDHGLRTPTRNIDHKMYATTKMRHDLNP